MCFLVWQVSLDLWRTACHPLLLLLLLVIFLLLFFSLSLLLLLLMFIYVFHSLSLLSPSIFLFQLKSSGQMVAHLEPASSPSVFPLTTNFSLLLFSGSRVQLILPACGRVSWDNLCCNLVPVNSCYLYSSCVSATSSTRIWRRSHLMWLHSLWKSKAM